MRVIALCLVLVASLWAHAILKESTPAARGIVQGPHTEFRLKFNSRIDGSRCRLSVENAGGTRAVKIAVQPSPDTLVGEANGLQPGPAVLRWQVFAVDGHLTRGELPFEVR